MYPKESNLVFSETLTYLYLFYIKEYNILIIIILKIEMNIYGTVNRCELVPLSLSIINLNFS